jgi:hypothetical protein
MDYVLSYYLVFLNTYRNIEYKTMKVPIDFNFKPIEVEIYFRNLHLENIQFLKLLTSIFI